MDATAVAERPLSARCPPSMVERGRRDDANFAVQRNQGRENRNAADVVARRVDGIDDPAARGVAALSELLADDGVLGALPIQLLANRVLDRLIDLRYRRLVGFGPH